MGKLSEQERAFLRENAFAAIATTVREDGTPHSTVVWVDEDGGDVVFNTARGRRKSNDLERDPRVTVTTVDPENMYRWVSVTGPVDLVEDGADANIDHMAKKYLGVDEYPNRVEGEVRVIVRVHPDRVTSVGLDG